MKSKTLLIIILLFPTFVLSSYSLTVLPSYNLTVISSPSLPDSLISRPWYVGTVFSKPAFAYFDENDPSTGYFFAATTAVPEVYQVQLKWKGGTVKTISFVKDDKKIKAKFTGEAGPDTISGFLLTSRKNAIRLGIIPELKIFMVKEIPDSGFQISGSRFQNRYHSHLFESVNVEEEVSYGAATGYYVSMPVNDEGYDYQQIILDAMSRMYVDPTKKAILDILNHDPVSFGTTDIQPLRMDIYQPLKDTLSRRPLLLLLHGGAFILGDKAVSTMQELARDFAGKGYVVAAVNYRMGFNPASKSSLERAAYRAVQDARAALRYLSANASTYRIDPNWVFLGGSSAGAITALNTAFMEEHERPESTGRNLWRAQLDLGGLDESTNTLSGPFRVRAVVNLWGAVNDTSIIDSYENIPVLSIHGDADRIVPYNYNYPFLDLDTTITANIVSKLYGSNPVHQRLKNLGIQSELITLPGAGHEPQTEPGMLRPVMDTIIEKATDFYFRAMFGFPEIAGPRQIAIGMSPTVFSLPEHPDLDFYWQVEGGKIVPGGPHNTARVVWLARGSGNVRLLLKHRNMANVEIVLPVRLPD